MAEGKIGRIRCVRAMTSETVAVAAHPVGALPTKLARRATNADDFRSLSSGAQPATLLAVTLLRSILARTALVALVACASPTLPLPPPDAPLVSAGVRPGTVHLVGANAQANAEILIRNMNDAVPRDHQLGGSIVNPDGTWDADVYGGNGDVLNITQQVGNDISPPAIVTIKL